MTTQTAESSDYALSDINQALDIIDKQAAEIERLKLAEIVLRQSGSAQTALLLDELERLRAALKQLDKDLGRKSILECANVVRLALKGQPK